jgi:hypothetical protein
MLNVDAYIDEIRLATAILGDYELRAVAHRVRVEITSSRRPYQKGFQIRRISLWARSLQSIEPTMQAIMAENVMSE